MIVNLQFFAYDDPGRQSFHRLVADTQVSSLAGFMYGDKIILTEQIDGSTSQSYVVAKLPMRGSDYRVSEEPALNYDIYLAHEAEWSEFKAHRDDVSNPWYGPSL